MLRPIPLVVIALTVPSLYALSRLEPRSPAAIGEAQTTVPQPSLTAFKARLDEYLKLRKEITKKYPEVKETGNPAKISERERALGQAIAIARASAKPGDIFGDAAPHLERILAEDWSSRTDAEKKGLLEEIPRNLVLKVNQPYPTTIPLVSAPGKLLERLPMLPEELEYRIVDRRLLLRDRDANLIIDVLAGAPPSRDR